MTILNETMPQIPWELPKKYLSYGVLDYVDLSLTTALFSESQLTEESALFIAFLSAASRAGHLCVKMEGDKIAPSPELFFEWKEEISTQEQTCLIDTLIQALKKGIRDLPQAMEAIIRYQNAFYFQKYWGLETAFLEALQDFMCEKPSLQLSQEKIGKILEAKVSSGLLTKRQSQAVSGINRCGLTVITGGPGTGKTYTAGQLIDVILQSLEPGQMQRFCMGFAAPTGKAASNLQGSLLRSIQDEQLKKDIKVATLHTLLEVKPHVSTQEFIRLPFDLLVVDEASMIDLKIKARLFKALKKGSRLILLGDKFQLPPIEAGSPFGDLMDILKLSSNPPVELMDCLRAELVELVNFAQHIKNGEIEKLNFSEIIQWHDLENFQLEKIKAQLLDQMHGYFINQDPESILKSFKKFRILCSLRQGPLGVDELNSFFYKYFKNRRVKAHPIMIVSNDERLNLFNGEVGVIQDSHAFFFDQNQKIRKIPSILLPRYDYAYCLSVHKSQGSEFDHVVFIMPEGSEVFGRELLYTAVTRTRQTLEIWSKKKIFKQVLEQRNQRISSFQNRISSNGKIF